MPDAVTDPPQQQHPIIAEQLDPRFAAVARVYGSAALRRLGALRICVVGAGGVGSWAVEALARSGVGAITVIDDDVVSAGNVNRQLPALTTTMDRPKVEVLAERVAGINPACHCTPIRDFLTDRNLEAYLGGGHDCVIDAIDSIKFKAAMIAFCVRYKCTVVTTGGAGGRSDPTAVRVRDLSRTEHDPLAAKVRKQLRNDYGFPRNPRRRFGVQCVFSMEQPVYPRGDGEVGRHKPGVHGVHLDCRLGYGSVVAVTATFGMAAASRALALGLHPLTSETGTALP
jgi:tRNA A37 threonylcarbamoyladenosine dehydratase